MLDPVIKRALARLYEAPRVGSVDERPPWVDGEWHASERSGLVLPPDSYLVVPSDAQVSRKAFGAGIGSHAIEARKAGETRRADSLFRLAFARGERTPEVVEAIEAMTSRILSSGLSVDIVEAVDGPEKNSEYSLSDVASVRHFFEDRVGSNITLMDVADVMDIFSPLFPLERISIHYDGREGAARNEIAVDGVYRGVEGDGLDFEVAFNAEDGKAQIVFTSIDVGEFTRMGFGVRSLLSRSVFLRRHGLMGWRDKIWDEGLIVWPRLGAVVDDESARLASAMLECLDMLGVAKGFEDVSPTMDIIELTGIELNAEDVLDVGALHEWFDIYADIPEKELEFIHPPYRVGMMALESISVSGYFDAATTLHRLVREYLPDRIMRMGTWNITERDRSAKLMADIGLFMAYQNTLFESDAIEGTETKARDVRAQPMERKEAFKGIVRSPGGAGLLLRPEGDPHLELPVIDPFYVGSAFESGELLVASGLFAAATVKIA